MENNSGILLENLSSEKRCSETILYIFHGPLNDSNEAINRHTENKIRVFTIIGLPNLCPTRNIIEMYLNFLK